MFIVLACLGWCGLSFCLASSCLLVCPVIETIWEKERVRSLWRNRWEGEVKREEDRERERGKEGGKGEERKREVRE